MTAAATDELQVHRRDRVVEVVFNRPHRHNAFTREMYVGLRGLCADLAGDTSVRVLVLRGAGGRAFAAGNEITDFVDTDAVGYEALIRGCCAASSSCPRSRWPRSRGSASVADSPSRRTATCAWRPREPGSATRIARTLGNALSASVLYRCAIVFGEPLTREMLLASRLVAADRAYAVGALLAVTEDLDTDLAELVDGLLSASGVSLRATKRQLTARARVLEFEPDGDDELLREVYTGADFAEGVRAFVAKEKPDFRG